MTISHSAITIDGATAWLVVECPPDSAPARWEQADKQCDTCGGCGEVADESLTLGVACPDCDGTGRHTFTLDVECVLPMCVNGQRGYWQDGHPCGYCNATGTSHLSVHVVEVLPIYGKTQPPTEVRRFIAKWRETEWVIADRDAYTGQAVNMPTDAANDVWAVRLAVH
jgi:hypothetical protein